MESGICCRYRKAWGGTHPQAAGFVMSCSKPVAIARDVYGSRDSGKYLPHLIGRLIHGVPRFAVVRRRIDRNKRAANAKFVGLGRKGYAVTGITSLKLGDATDGHDNTVFVHLAEHVYGVYVRDLLEQLRLGIGSVYCSSSRGCNL